MKTFAVLIALWLGGDRIVIGSGTGRKRPLY